MSNHVWIDNDDTLVLQTSVDVTANLEHAKALRSAGLTGTSDVKHAAHYPPEIILAWCQRRGITYGEWLRDNNKHVMAMLNDPDLSEFRIWKGRC